MDSDTDFLPPSTSVSQLPFLLHRLEQAKTKITASSPNWSQVRPEILPGKDTLPSPPSSGKAKSWVCNFLCEANRVTALVLGIDKYRAHGYQLKLS